MGVRENDIVIHPTLCHKLRLKDAKLRAHSLPWVRYHSSNKVNNCFTLTHTLVLLEAKLPSCCGWYWWHTLLFSPNVARRRLFVVVIYLK